MSNSRVRQNPKELKAIHRTSTRLSPVTQLSTLQTGSERHDAILRLQQTAGNQQVQRYLASEAAVQREDEPQKRSAWQRVEDFFTGESDEEKMLAELNEGLERSQKLCERASLVVSDAAAAERLKSAAEHFEQVHGVIEKGLNVVGTGRDITKFVKAARKLDSIDIAQDQKTAAEAFDELFGAVGSLAKKLPEGPWSFYFEFLAKFGEYHFFSNMRQKIDPSERWKSNFSQIEGMNF